MEEMLDFSIARTVRGSELLGGSGRASRIAWLATKIKENDLYHLQDGAFSQLLFHETAESYVNGQFVATIVLGFSFIERAIAGRLHHVNDKVAERGSSEQLIAAALKRQWITREESEALNRLRLLRNPVIHFRGHLELERPEVKALLSARSVPQLLEGDAMATLEAAIHVVLNATAL